MSYTEHCSVGPTNFIETTTTTTTARMKTADENRGWKPRKISKFRFLNLDLDLDLIII